MFIYHNCHSYFRANKNKKTKKKKNDHFNRIKNPSVYKNTVVIGVLSESMSYHVTAPVLVPDPMLLGTEPK